MQSARAPLGELDLTDTDNFAQGAPWALFRRMREEAPVLWLKTPADWPAHEVRGYWNLTRAEDINRVLRDTDTFSSHLGGMTIRSDSIAPLPAVQAMMIGKDPPEHSRQRAVVSREFTPSRAEALRPLIQRHVDRCIDDVIERGECDFVRDFASAVPLEVICDLLGVPAADRWKFHEWTDRIIAFDDPEVQALGSGAEAIEQATAYFMNLIEQRQKQPADDLATLLGRSEHRGQDMPISMRVGLFNQLFSAGNDTVRVTLALALEALIAHPDQMRLLAANPALLAGPAQEEIHRFVSVVLYMRRTARHDSEIGGQTIRAGDAVVCWYAAGNRDPAAVSDPDRLDLTRQGVPHFAFGTGRHFCIGAQIARLQIEIALTQLLARMHDLRLAGPIDRMRANWLQGVKRMPIAFAPGPRQARAAA